jgi:hypothetical protein
MMDKILYSLAGALLLFVILAVIASRDGHPAGDRQPEEGGTKPSIYITRTDQVRTIEGKTVWILEYTVDGIVQAPFFNSQEAMTRYRAYLDTIGTVYEREEEE